MKKSFNRRKVSSEKQDGYNFEMAMVKIQQQLSALERKLDSLIGNSSGRGLSGGGRERPFFGGNNNPHRRDMFRKKKYFKAVCSDCNNECDVPFRPTGERPVYCSDCFTKRRAEGRLSRQNPEDDSRKEQGGGFDANETAPEHKPRKSRKKNLRRRK